MIYGASGYTGKLLARRARELGYAPILAGRSPEKTRAVAAPLGFEGRVVRLDNADRLRDALGDVDLVLHAAGPFSATSEPLVDACLATGTHYLDVTGEVPVFEALARHDGAARERNVMIMPGVGFMVVPSDCLAAHVADRLPGAHRLRIAFSRATLVSKGSAKTIVELVSERILVREEGRLTTLPVGRLERRIDYGSGPRSSLGVTWGDLVTAFHTTAIPNIEAYLETNAVERGMLVAGSFYAGLARTASWQILLKTQADLFLRDPTDEERARCNRTIVVEAEGAAGVRLRARLHTPESYTFTSLSALAVVERVLRGDFKPGFQTPARVFGADFVLGMEGVRREDAVEVPDSGARSVG